MNKYKIVRIKKPKFKGSKWARIKNYFRKNRLALILFASFSLFGIGGMIINLYANNIDEHPINLNIKIEDLEKFKKHENKDGNFNFNDIDHYIKNNFINENLNQEILDIYGDINSFKKNDLETFKQLLSNEIVENSWFDSYYKVLIKNNFNEIESLESQWNNIYNNGIQNSSVEKNVQNYNQFEFLSTVKDFIEIKAQLQGDQLNDIDKKDLIEGIKFIKNMQYQFLINNKWYRLLAYSFVETLNSEQIIQKQAYSNDLKTISHQWLENMESQLYDDKNQWFWYVNGYKEKKNYESSIKLLHKFPKNENITRNDLFNVLKESNFFNQINTDKKEFNINDFWIKYNGYSKIEQKNEGTKENPKYSWRNYYKFTFKSKDLDACFELNIVDNNFRFINLDFNVDLKYNDIFENYQNKYLIDLLENKQSWLILFDFFK